MSNAPELKPSVPLTPCIGLCRLDDSGHCAGCHRTGEEIARWSRMSDAERLYVMRVILPTRRQQ